MYPRIAMVEPRPNALVPPPDAGAEAPDGAPGVHTSAGAPRTPRPQGGSGQGGAADAQGLVYAPRLGWSSEGAAPSSIFVYESCGCSNTCLAGPSSMIWP